MLIRLLKRTVLLAFISSFLLSAMPANFTAPVTTKTVTGVDSDLELQMAPKNTTKVIIQFEHNYTLRLETNASLFCPIGDILLIAYLMNNSDPLKGYLIIFEMYDPQNKNLLTMHAFTNASGMATIVFRIPTISPDPEYASGNYTVVAKTTVEGVPLQDSITFYVGWEVELQEVITCKENRGLWMPTTEFTKREHMIFLITIKNNIPEVRQVTISLLVYDEDGLLIAYALLQTAILNETQMTLCLEIPEWAHVGTAWVDVNAHTNLPWVDGRPYCPRISASFTIKEG